MNSYYVYSMSTIAAPLPRWVILAIMWWNWHELLGRSLSLRTSSYSRYGQSPIRRNPLVNLTIVKLPDALDANLCNGGANTWGAAMLRVLLPTL